MLLKQWCALIGNLSSIIFYLCAFIMLHIVINGGIEGTYYFFDIPLTGYFVFDLAFLLLVVGFVLQLAVTLGLSMQPPQKKR